MRDERTRIFLSSWIIHCDVRYNSAQSFRSVSVRVERSVLPHREGRSRAQLPCQITFSVLLYPHYDRSKIKLTTSTSGLLWPFVSSQCGPGVASHRPVAGVGVSPETLPATTKTFRRFFFYFVPDSSRVENMFLVKRSFRHDSAHIVILLGHMISKPRPP